MTLFSLTFAALSAACLANAIGDVFMLYGVRYTNWEPGVEAMQQTPERYIKWGALSGLVTVSAWFLLVPAAAQVGGGIGWALALAFCFYVGVTLSFHVSYLFVGLGVKADNTLAEPFAGLLGLISAASFLGAVSVSVLWAVDLFMRSASLFYLACTPAFTILFFQMFMGRFLGRAPYYKVVAGPIAMVAFFAGFLHYTEAVIGWHVP